MKSGSITLREVDFRALSVLVIGDIMLDHFRYGSVRRISPEAPVPVVHIEDEKLMLGGAGNVAANLASLGCRCSLIAMVGNDRHAATCRQLLDTIGVDSRFLFQAEKRRTTVKTRLIGASQQLLRFDEEDLSPISEAEEQALIDLLDSEAAHHQVIAVSDYAKGVLTDRVLRHVITRGRELGIPVIVDPKRKDFTAYAGATVIKPNCHELSAATGIHCSDIADCSQATAKAIELTGADILLTMAQNGMALARKGQEPLHVPTVAAEVFDVSGAGDTVMASLCAMIAAGLELDFAVNIANVAAGIVVRKLGTATVTRAELIRAFDASNVHTHLGSVSSEQAVMVVEKWRESGLRVGFTNGCFDIVHAGHIAILREARRRCDRLVVGLNSDASVTRLKGPGRPVQSESSRAAVLAAIDAVDLVVLFDEDTPLRLITMLRPSDLIKGADYSEDAVVGAREVKADGGRVHLIDLLDGHSTTAAVQRILEGKRKAAEGGHLARSLAEESAQAPGTQVLQ
jgi:D-beta-D-heptose 7-phosphate kinase/D-beta-D-heptose 1-phosphate adenosyltransferase